jgi:hypothetical protein
MLLSSDDTQPGFCYLDNVRGVFPCMGDATNYARALDIKCQEGSYP